MKVELNCNTHTWKRRETKMGGYQQKKEDEDCAGRRRVP